MKGIALLRERWLRCEAGNTTILLTTICLAFIGVTILSLDIFSILISRHYAQTDADTAAIAGVLTIQPIATQAFADAVDRKVDQMIQTAVADWRAEAPDSDRDDYVRAWLSERIGDAEVFAYLTGQSKVKPAPARIITAVLTPRERGCTLERTASDAQVAALSRAKSLLRDPSVSTVTLAFPVDNKPWVVVTMQRTIPSVLIHKVLAHPPVVSVESGATLRGLAEMTFASCV